MGFEFAEDGGQSFQWEMDEALEMATKKQVSWLLVLDTCMTGLRYQCYWFPLLESQ